MGNDALLKLNPACTQKLFGKVPDILVQKGDKEHSDIVTVLIRELPCVGLSC